MLTYNIENKGNIPLYEYLYRCIKEDILNGKLKENEKYFIDDPDNVI